MVRGVVGIDRKKQFFIDGRKLGLSPEEFGIMAVELSLVPARNMVELTLNLTHNNDDTSLIHQISKSPDFAMANFFGIGVAAYVSYAGICLGIPEGTKPDMGVGVAKAIARLSGNSELLLGLFTTYLPLVYWDTRMGGPSDPSGTQTHRTLIKILSQQYSGNEDLEDFEGLDSVTMAPFTNNYYLSVMALLRDIGQLRYAHT